VQEGSEYHGTAARLKQVFEERYAKSIRDEGQLGALATMQTAGVRGPL